MTSSKLNMQNTLKIKSCLNLYKSLPIPEGFFCNQYSAMASKYYASNEINKIFVTLNLTTKIEILTSTKYYIYELYSF